MCSINDFDETGEPLASFEDKLSLCDDMVCRRCQMKEANVVLKRSFNYCKECFLAYVTHKFRASLGKSKIMKPSDKVLVGFAGGQSSLALLHMLWTGTHQGDHKKLLYKIVFCYIDDGAIFGKTLEERKQALLSNKNVVETYGFKFYITTLSRSLNDEHPVLDNELQLKSIDDEPLIKLFEQLRSVTAKEDLLLNLRRQLLVKVARDLQSNKLFTAEEQTSLAVKLLSSIALGKGEQLPQEVGFEDSRHEGVLILRPMRDIDKSEIVHYNKFNHLTTTHQCNSFSTSLPSSTSIQRLTEEFINGLQEEYPSTVSIVYRTGEKLSGNTHSLADLDHWCILCKCATTRLPNEDLYSAVDAVAFSRLVSQPSGSVQSAENRGCCGDCACDMSYKYTEDQLRNCFCYGCMLIIREMQSVHQLPAAIWNQVQRRSCLQNMQKQIADYLL